MPIGMIQYTNERQLTKGETMKKIGETYLDQGRMWQDVEFENGDEMPRGHQFFSSFNRSWINGGVPDKWTHENPSIYERRIPVENKVQQNAKKNLHLLKEMLLNKAKIVKKNGDRVRVVDYPTLLLKDGEFFELAGETHKLLQEDQTGPDKYAIFEALAEGKSVQFKSYENTDKWEDFNYFDSNCHFNAMNHLYRIKPEEIPDTVIKWTSVATPPTNGRVVYILHESGTIQTVQFWNGKFMDNGREMRFVRGWSHA